MKKILAGVMILMFVVVIFSASAKAESTITGTWKQIDDQGVNKGKVASYVEIFEKDGVYFGKITKLLLDPPDTVCKK
jgi:hypothetical protein